MKDVLVDEDVADIETEPENQSGASSPAHFQPRRPNYARRQERSPKEDIHLDGLSEEERI